MTYDQRDVQPGEHVDVHVQFDNGATSALSGIAIATDETGITVLPDVPKPTGNAVVANWTIVVSIDRQPGPEMLVRSYTGTNQAEVNKAFEAEATHLATVGYSPQSQSWADGQPSLVNKLALGIEALLVAPPGSLTVTYLRRQAAAAEVRTARPTKACPECAEEVLADARICRFCRHEFWPA
jgi:Uncharacterised protein family UPF0547